MPCSHTFCQGCREKLAEQARTEGRQGFPCPVCRATTAVDHHGLKNLAALEESKASLPLSDISNRHSSVELERESENVHMQSQGMSQPQEQRRARCNSADDDRPVVEEVQHIDTNVGLRQHGERPASGSFNVQSSAGRQFMTLSRRSQQKSPCTPAEADLTVCGGTRQPKDQFCFSCKLIHCQTCADQCGQYAPLSQDDLIFSSFGNKASLLQLQAACKQFSQLDVEVLVEVDRARAESAKQLVSSNADGLQEEFRKLLEVHEQVSHAVDSLQPEREKKTRAIVDQLRADVPAQKPAVAEALHVTRSLAAQSCHQSSAPGTEAIHQVVNSCASRTIEAMKRLGEPRGESQLADASRIAARYASEQLSRIAE